MGSRRALLVLVVAAAAVSVAMPAHPAPQKKKCATVVKKVHGKKRKVKVCPKKVNVSVKLDTAHSASLTITTGATSSAISTFGSKGKVTLTLPGGAVQSGVTIRVTPIKSAAHLPLKSLVAGVQLEPDGLQLDKAATLTIQAAKVPKGRLVGFTYAGNGRALHPYPVTRSGNVLTFRIGHFSGYGAGIESDPGRVALVQAMLAEQQALVAALLAAATPSQLGDSGVLYRYQAWMSTALAFHELVPFREMLRTTAQQAFRVATAWARADCTGLHKLGTVYDMFRAIELARSIGIADVVDPVAELDLKECLSFELDFDAVVTWTVEGHAVTSHVRSEKLRLDWTNQWRAQQPLDYVSFSFLDLTGCTVSSVLHVNAPFKADMHWMRDSLLRLNDRDRIALDVDVGRASETVTIACPGGVTQTTEGAWHNGIFLFHGNSFTFTILDWSLSGGSVFATRDYVQTIDLGEGTISERTHFVLRHVPR